MKTYRDILRHHIRNKDLLALIEHYCETSKEHRGGVFFRDGVDIDEDVAVNYMAGCDLRRTINRSFCTTYTNETSIFWGSFVDAIPQNVENFYIDEWEHIDEWFKDESIPELIVANKEKYIGFVLQRLTTEIDYLRFFNIRHVLTLICRCTDWHKFLTEDEIKVISFFFKHRRFPNDFDI